VLALVGGPASAQSLSSVDQFGSDAYDEAWAVAVAADGTAYVAGFTGGVLPGQTSHGGNDAFVRAIAADGTELWTRQFGTHGDDRAFSVALDGLGGVYVNGATTGALHGSSAGGFDAFVRKYDTAGNVVWTQQFGTGADDFDSEVVADASGAYAIGWTAGAFAGTSRGRDDVFVSAFAPDGSTRWSKQFGTHAEDIGYGVALGADGTLYAIGFTTGALKGQRNRGGDDGFVRAFTPDGDRIWTSEFGTPSEDLAFGMAVWGDTVYVSGTTFGSFGGQGMGGGDPFVRAIAAADGSRLWSRQGGTTDEDWATNLAVDANGPYAVGWTRGDLGGANAGREDVFVWALDPTGADRWTFQLGSTKTDFGDWSAVDGGSLVIVGFAGGSLGGQPKLGGGDAYLARIGLA
jgi:hypothetical protein